MASSATMRMAGLLVAPVSFVFKCFGPCLGFPSLGLGALALGYFLLPFAILLFGQAGARLLREFRLFGLHLGGFVGLRFRELRQLRVLLRGLLGMLHFQLVEFDLLEG